MENKVEKQKYYTSKCASAPSGKNIWRELLSEMKVGEKYPCHAPTHDSTKNVRTCLENRNRRELVPNAHFFEQPALTPFAPVPALKKVAWDFQIYVWLAQKSRWQMACVVCQRKFRILFIRVCTVQLDRKWTEVSVSVLSVSENSLVILEPSQDKMGNTPSCVCDKKSVNTGKHE